MGLFCGLDLTALLLSLLLMLGGTRASLSVSLSRKKGAANGNSLTMITFCIDCPSPQLEGSLAYGLQAKFGLREFAVVGTLVYCVPNNAEARKVFNAHHFRDRIVLVDRGNIGLLDKAVKIQDSEAVGIIIADDGRCRDDFSFCGAQAGSAGDGGYGPYDNENRWKEIDIPVILVTVKTADILRKMMGIRKVNMPRLGMQNITVFHTGADSYKDEL